MYINTRERCESAFLSRIMHILILGGVKMPTKEQHEELADLAYQSVMDSFVGLSNEESIKLKRRIKRMEDLTIAPLSNKAHGQEVLLTSFYFMNELIEQSIMEIAEGSKLRQLTDFLLKVVDEEIPSCAERAKNWIDILRSEGYYK